MNKLIANYKTANDNLRDYLGIDEWQSIDFRLGAKWADCGESIRFIEDDEEYVEEIANEQKIVKDDVTTFLIRSCSGGGDCYTVFDNKNYKPDMDI